MKTKSILFSFFFLSLSLIGFAQEDTTTPVEKPKAKIWFGPKFGLDLAHFTTDVNEIKSQLGDNYQAGLLCQIGEKLYLQPEIYYASTKTSDSIRVNFLKAPIMLGLRILDIGLLSVHIMGGPQFSFKLDSSDKLTGDQTLTWQVGAGADVLGFITADLRYTIVPGQSVSTQVSSFNLNTTGLNLTVGLKFR